MRYTSGEVTGLAAATLAIAGIGVGMNFADTTPHYGEHAEYAADAAAGSSPVLAPPGSDAANAGADYARPAAPAAAVPAPSPVPTPEEQGLVIHRVLPISGPIRYGEWHWDEAGVPAGPLIVTVDLEARVLSVFRGGYEIGTTAVLLGTQEKPTPTGVFPITQKDANHVSNLYDAPMPYMLRLTNDGVTIHATNVQNGYASHGCIGVPKTFARKLFGEAKLGDRVYVTRGKHVGVGDQLT